MNPFPLLGWNFQGEGDGLSLLFSKEALLLRLTDCRPAPCHIEEESLCFGRLRSIKVRFSDTFPIAGGHRMADAKVYDAIHPKKPLFLRTYTSVRSFTSALLPLPDKQLRCHNIGSSHQIWEIPSAHSPKGDPVSAWLLPFGALCVEEEGTLLAFGTGEGGFFLCVGTETQALALLNTAMEELTFQAFPGKTAFFSEVMQHSEQERQTWDASFSAPLSEDSALLLRLLLARLDRDGVIRDPTDPHPYDLRRQSYALQQLCRVILPHSPLAAICHTLYAACFSADQPTPPAVPFPHRAAAYPLWILALTDYEAIYDPPASGRHRKAYLALLEETRQLSRQGWLPHPEGEVFPFAHTFTPSCSSTLEQIVCRHRLAALAGKSFDTEQALKIFRCEPPSLLLPGRTYGYCDACRNRLPSPLPATVTLCYADDRPYYLCPTCRRKGRWEASVFPPLPKETYGFLPLPIEKNDSFPHRLRREILRRTKDGASLVQQALCPGTAFLASLPTVSLTDLFLLSLCTDVEK